MPIKFERRSLALTSEEWATLEQQAREFNTCPPTGPTAFKPSWRSLLKAIADGKIVLKPAKAAKPAKKGAV